MKINFISYNNGYGLTKDMKLLQTILEENYKDIDIQICDFYDHKAKLALQGSQALVTIRNAYLSNIWTDLRSQ